MAGNKKINRTNLVTLISVAILVGTEFVGVAWAGGWALGGLFQLPPLISHALEGIGVVIGLVLWFYFVRAAAKAEPIYE